MYFICDDGKFFLSDDIIDQMLQELNVKLLDLPLNQTYGTNSDDFEAAGKAFLFLVFCPSDKSTYLSRLVLKYNVTEILNNIKQIWEKDKEFFEILEKRLDFSFRNILRISKLEKNGNSSGEINTTHYENHPIQQISNHPVHLIDSEGNLSPTALIPFCEFGGSMASLGIQIKEFDVPICTSFEPVIFKKQLCYQLDVNKYRTGMKKGAGLTFLVDFNEDRHLSLNDEKNPVPDKQVITLSEIEDSGTDFVYLNTLGQDKKFKKAMLNL